MSRLEVRDLTVGYEGAPVLHGVDVEVPERELLAIVGPSGCGKTTLLRTIAGLLRARSGEIRIGLRMVTTHGIHLAPEKRRIGWVPQDAALFPHLTVAENVAFGMLAGRGSSRAARRAAGSDEVRRLLDLVDLGPLAARQPGQLSGGQAQRVALARALASGPELVLLDEPFGALDPMLRAELRASVRELLRAEGVTGILVTHDQAEALSIADRVAVMRGGQVLQLGTPEEVYRSPATPWVAGFVGDAVFLTGVLHGDEVVTGLGRMRAVPAADASGQAPADGSEVTVLVRPEEVRVRRADAPSVATPADEVELDGIVTEVEYTGHDAMLVVALADGQRLRARVTASGLVPRGSEVRVSIAGPVLAYAPATD
ncbi:ABC transporter ATP-binding protein [Agromyces marinus]|uniref:ABC transporter ATP-binding protein n=1 Tax=Agromyces marinus TaxID=1389020 RepID=A0ABM8H2G4_9MICO|nr:ABC transporter ATP-binding protein [Agromyces marinus]UIP59922.1 Fe(3+) ions import ATP-binding protein FbpC [Agromyces marinus]BDZ54985.1 ABC transporter ATP-binding protein [Agromyces marinus]